MGSTVTSHLDLILPYFTGSWVLLIALSIWKPQRFKNALLLMVALFFTCVTIACFFGAHMITSIFVMLIIAFIVLLFVPFLLVWNGMLVMKREGKSKANMLSLLLGIGIGIGEIAFLSIILSNALYSTDKKIYGVVAFVGVSIFYFSCILLTFVVYNLYIQYIPKTISFDYVIIHGCGLINGKEVSPLLASRIDKAIEVFNKTKIKPILIPSGGRGDDETLSEAEAMKGYLLEHGIPEDKIYLEDKSTTTMENLANCKRYIESQGKKKKVALVSSNYHVYRCMLHADELKMRCIGIGAKVAWYYWPTALIREFVAVFTRPKYLIWTAVGYAFFVAIPIIQIFF